MANAPSPPKQRTTLSLSFETKKKLDSYGMKGDSYDDILNKLMKKEAH